ncbi:MAG TPA: 1,2-phenylacetyl-CoA epoxidase subunit PaaC [Acidimicrobiia bacterium]|nr:paaC [Acidimicrobiia bacterium]HYJ24052.1 1,2-phenylacetyl-CoA epoxidase subunit PaaC [Acidimicrobiia bacterium]
MSEPVISTAPQGAPASDSSDPVRALVAHADDNLVLAQRLGDWISRAPELEEDIALGNIALDHLGVARALYSHAGHLEGKGRTEDDFAMQRPEREFLNALLVEQPNGDFAHTMVRGLLFDAYQVELWTDLSGADDSTLAGIAGLALKEARYHLLHTSSWVIRLGDGTEESHRRAQAAVDALWRYTAELFEGAASEYHDIWRKVVGEVLDEARLQIPDDPYQRSGGRRGFHSEHLGPLLAEMQWMQRSHPGLEW